MYREHSSFKSPPDDTTIWRYMDLTKYLSMLETQSLFFSTPNNLGDPFEGAITKEFLSHQDQMFQDRMINVDEKIAEIVDMVGFPDILKESAKQTFINCWHINPCESEAMWKLYSNTESGIAVKTDIGSFKSSFICDEDIYIGAIQYTENNHDIPVEFERFIERFLFKRTSFEHEKELRAITRFYDGIDPVDYHKYYKGKYIKVDISMLIKDVVVYPFAPEWFIDLVKRVTDKYKDIYNFGIVKSNMNIKSIFN